MTDVTITPTRPVRLGHPQQGDCHVWPGRDRRRGCRRRRLSWRGPRGPPQQGPSADGLPLEAGHAYASDAYPTSLLGANKIADPDHDWGYTARDTDQIPQIPTPRGCTTAAPKAPPTRTG